MLRRVHRTKLGEKGFTLMEIVVVLGVIALLGAILTPMILTYVEDAKRARAEGDAQQIGAAIAKLTKDVDHFPAYTNGNQTAGDATIHLLCSPGNLPTLASGVTGWDGIPAASAPCATDGGSKVDQLANHLVKNEPGGSAATQYATGAGARGRFWRGPYVEKINEDPYGNSYVVNIVNAPANSAVAPKVVWVLSAGPDGKIDTGGDFNADAGPAVGGDDIAIRLK